MHECLKMRALGRWRMRFDKKKIVAALQFDKGGSFGGYADRPADDRIFGVRIHAGGEKRAAWLAYGGQGFIFFLF